MLKLSPYTAQGFLAYAQVRSNITQWHSFQYMRCLLQQVFISFRCRFEMCVYKPFFQPDIIFFVGDSYQPFYFMIPVKKFGKCFFRDHP